MNSSMEAALTDKNFPQSNISRSWVIFSFSSLQTSNIQREIDGLFSSRYSFYPEVEWDYYGFRPPENCQVLGAWRNPNPQAKVFAFLLDNPKIVSMGSTTQLVLRIVGDPNEISTIEPQVVKLKERYTHKDKEKSEDQVVKERIDEMGNSKSLMIFEGILGLITGIINVFSLYLRQLPPPNLSSKFLVDFYNTFMVLVQFIALLLLLAFAVTTLIFIVKFGLLIIKKR